MRRWLLSLIIALTAAPAAAEDGPPPGFFAGTYELLGRAPGAEGAPLMDWVTITVGGERLELSACRAGKGSLSPISEPDEHSPYFSGRLGAWTLGCDYRVDRGNYAQITCGVRSESADVLPGLLTLWPAHGDPPPHAAGCE